MSRTKLTNTHKYYTDIYDRLKTRSNELIEGGFNTTKEYLDLFQFRTKESNNIVLEYLEYAISEIDRTKSIFQFMKFVNADIATKLEARILEYTLIKASYDKITPDFITNIYNDKIRDVLSNIDRSNERVSNQSLTPSLIKGRIDPYFVGFLRPEQIHPARW